MGKYAETMDLYMSNNDRFAEMFNIAVFQGESVVRADELEDDEAHYIENSREQQFTRKLHRFRDVKKRTKSGEKLILTAIENQEIIDYTMPYRMMEYDRMEYGKQLKEIQKEKEKRLQEAGKKPTKWLTRPGKDDKLHPVYSICFYHGTEKWDGPKSLKDMMDFEGMHPSWKEMFHDYGMTLFCVEDVKDFSQFKTGLGQFLPLLCNRRNRKAIETLLNQEEYRTLDRDTAEIIAIFTDNTEVLERLDEYETEGGYDMCQAMDEWRSELLNTGKSEGRATTLLNNVRCIMEELKYTAEQAMDLLKIPEEERGIYRSKL